MRQFRYYTNRRIYCFKNHKYVTHQAIVNCIYKGEDICITTTRNKDVTAYVLAQAISSIIKPEHIKELKKFILLTKPQHVPAMLHFVKGREKCKN